MKQAELSKKVCCLLDSLMFLLSLQKNNLDSYMESKDEK